MGKTIHTTKLYNTLNELLRLTNAVTENLPRSVRYTIGSEIIQRSVRMLTDFAEAYHNADHSSVEKMNSLLANLETVKVLVSMAIENRWIYGQKKSGRLIRLLDSISIQSTALRNAFVSRFAKDEKSGAYETKVSATDASSD
jgi:hypothetical protein